MIYITLLVDKVIGGLLYRAGSHIKVEFDYGLSLINASPQEAVEYSENIAIDEDPIVEQLWSKNEDEKYLYPTTEPVDVIVNGAFISDNGVDGVTTISSGSLSLDVTDSHTSPEYTSIRNDGFVNGDMLYKKRIYGNDTIYNREVCNEIVTTSEVWDESGTGVSWKINTTKTGSDNLTDSIEITGDGTFDMFNKARVRDLPDSEDFTNIVCADDDGKLGVNSTIQNSLGLWKRTSSTEIRPTTDGDDITTIGGFVNVGDGAGNVTTIFEKGVQKYTTNQTLTDVGFYTNPSFIGGGNVINHRYVVTVIDGVTKTAFQESIETGETWTTASKAIRWIIRTVKSGSTELTDRLRITKDGEFRIGNETNYTQFNEDGKLRMQGTATVWDDLTVQGMAVFRNGVNDPTPRTFVGNTIIYGFSASLMNECFFNIQIPHSWKEGSAIEPHVHWTPLSSPVSTQNVVWKFEYTWVNNTETYTTASTVSVTGATGTSGNKHLISSFGTVSGAGKSISSVLICRLYRDAANAADTYTGEAGLLSFDIHIEKDTLGSDTEYGK